MNEFFGGKARRKEMLGEKVDRPTATIPQNGQYALFDITGGQVLVTLIVGEVTLAIGGSDSFKLIGKVTVGQDTDLCGAVDMTAGDIGDLLGITGTPATNMLVSHKGSIQAMLTGGVVLQTGSLDFDTTASEAGEVKWLVTYFPLEDGAKMTVNVTGTTT